ncbi:MAG: serine/threonine protein kinase [bacterium]|nr:serine/threonine protein kinase [bacterium]
MQTRAIGSVEVRAKIATRESGEFFLGRQPGVDRMVVLRKLRADLLSNTRLVERFRREARLGGRVVHPNIVGIFDLFGSRGDHYLVMEHVDGPDLREILSWDRKLRPGIVARIGLELARGLSEVHDRGVIHGDFRPENIQLSRWGDVKIGGFGYAREADEEEPPELPVESEYSAPPLGAAGAPAARLDVYSFGVVLREMLTTHGEPPSGLRASRLERSLARLIEQCVAELAAQRPSAAAIVAKLEAIQTRLGAPETRNEIAAWLVLARRGTPAQVKPAEKAKPPARVEVRETAEGPRAKRKIGLPLAGGGVLALLLGASLFGPAPAPSDPEADLDVTPPVNAGVDTATASVRFAVYPWAEVSIDARKPFLTPRAAELELSAGRHRVVFKHPTFGEVSREIQLEAGTTSVVRHVFQKASRP